MMMSLSPRSIADTAAVTAWSPEAHARVTVNPSHEGSRRTSRAISRARLGDVVGRMTPPQIIASMSLCRRPLFFKRPVTAATSATAATAKKKLMQLASWLEANGEDGAAASLREGLDETLTVMRLNLPASLRRTFATTNPIENMNGSLRRIARNVKRWKDETMIRRWVALGIAEAQKGFRRVKGYVHMPSLVAALRPDAAKVASEKEVA
jgi:Transposase, Mutator family